MREREFELNGITWREIEPGEHNDGWLVWVLLWESWPPRGYKPDSSSVLGVFWSVEAGIRAARGFMPELEADMNFEQVQRDWVTGRINYLGNIQTFRLIACPAGYVRKGSWV